ncbi:MAG: hypothetical protein F6K65_23460 [Moorea sp. SIO3C2]|nr:hypothetical protein [Moorena sp. SIO3C2]
MDLGAGDDAPPTGINNGFGAFGGAGNDLIYGGLGSDNVNGGANNDTLIGTDAQGTSINQTDTLTGGAGADTFTLALSTDQGTVLLYDDGDSNTTGIFDLAIITDFTIGEDIVILTGDPSQYNFDIRATSGSLVFLTLSIGSTLDPSTVPFEQIATFTFDTANGDNTNLDLSDPTQFQFI